MIDRKGLLALGHVILDSDPPLYVRNSEFYQALMFHADELARELGYPSLKQAVIQIEEDDHRQSVDQFMNSLPPLYEKKGTIDLDECVNGCIHAANMTDRSLIALLQEAFENRHIIMKANQFRPETEIETAEGLTTYANNVLRALLELPVTDQMDLLDAVEIGRAMADASARAHDAGICSVLLNLDDCLDIVYDNYAITIEGEPGVQSRDELHRMAQLQISREN